MDQGQIRASGTDCKGRGFNQRWGCCWLEEAWVRVACMEG